jgi:hypothetical protein
VRASTEPEAPTTPAQRVWATNYMLVTAETLLKLDRKVGSQLSFRERAELIVQATAAGGRKIPPSVFRFAWLLARATSEEGQQIE